MLIAGAIVAAYFLVGVGFWISFACFVVPIHKAYHHAPDASDHLIVLFLWFFVVFVGLTDESDLGPHG